MRPKEYTQNKKLEWKLYTIQYLVMICSDYSDTLFRPSRGAYVNNLSGPAIPPIPLATERLSPENRKHLENNGVTRSHSPLGGWWPIGPAVIKNPWSTFLDTAVVAYSGARASIRSPTMLLTNNFWMHHCIICVYFFWILPLILEWIAHFYGYLPNPSMVGTVRV